MMNISNVPNLSFVCVNFNLIIMIIIMNISNVPNLTYKAVSTDKNNRF